MNNEIHIKDNFLPRSFFHHLRKHLTSREVQWIFCRNATGGEGDDPHPNYLDDYYFSHTAYLNTNNTPIISPNFNIVQPILYFIEDKFKFEIKNLLRINFTLITQRKENITTQYHIDTDVPHYVAILYLNTCNGPTLIEDKQIDFIENRMVLFNGKIQHAAMMQNDSMYRMNIVMNIQGTFF
jgi:hypothetical protein